jgi:hypothetical protein
MCQQVRHQRARVALTKVRHPLQQVIVAEMDRGPAGDALHHGGDAHRHIPARGLCSLDVGVQRAIAAFLVHAPHQRQQQGGLARLARGVEDEAALLVDHPQHLVDIQPLQRVEHVMLIWLTGTGGVETTRRPGIVGRMPEPPSGFRKGFAPCTLRWPDNGRRSPPDALQGANDAFQDQYGEEAQHTEESPAQDAHPALTPHRIARQQVQQEAAAAAQQQAADDQA